MSVFWVHVLAWLPLACIAVANGVAREATYGRRLPEPAAHQVSTCIGCGLFFAYALVPALAFPLPDAAAALGVGLVWLGLTLAFEFGMGRWVFGHSCRRLLADYNLRRGRLWPLVLVTVTAAPWAAHKLLG